MSRIYTAFMITILGLLFCTTTRAGNDDAGLARLLNAAQDTGASFAVQPAPSGRNPQDEVMYAPNGVLILKGAQAIMTGHTDMAGFMKAMDDAKQQAPEEAASEMEPENESSTEEPEVEPMEEGGESDDSGDMPSGRTAPQNAPTGGGSSSMNFVKTADGKVNLLDDNGAVFMEGSFSKRNGVTFFEGKNKKGNTMLYSEYGTGTLTLAGHVVLLDPMGSFDMTAGSAGKILIRDNQGKTYTAEKDENGETILTDSDSNTATIMKDSTFLIEDSEEKAILEGKMDQLYALAVAHYGDRFPKRPVTQKTK